jgi:hypothetical protein
MNAFSEAHITAHAAKAAINPTAARAPNPAEKVEKPGTMRTINAATADTAANTATTGRHALNPTNMAESNNNATELANPLSRKVPGANVRTLAAAAMAMV